MRSLLLTTGTKVVTTVPRVAFRAAGTAWDIGESVVGKVLHRGTDDTPAPRPAAVPSPPREDVPEAEAPKGVPTPKRDEAQAAQPAEPPVQLAPEITVDEPAPAHEDLPLPDFDHLTVGSLRSRLRSLDLVQLRQLHAYETEHANRLPVTTLLANRIAKLEKEQAPANA